MSKQVFAKQASLVKALAHPSRLEIIHLLRTHTLTVTQMTKMLGVRQAYVSQQLLILKKARVVTAGRDGKEMYYAVFDPRIINACDSLYSLVSDKPLSAAPEPEVLDPVCGMKLTPSLSAHITEYNGVRHYFCGHGCLTTFTQKHRRLS